MKDLTVEQEQLVGELKKLWAQVGETAINDTEAFNNLYDEIEKIEHKLINAGGIINYKDADSDFYVVNILP